MGLNSKVDVGSPSMPCRLLAIAFRGRTLDWGESAGFSRINACKTRSPEYQFIFLGGIASNSAVAWS